MSFPCLCILNRTLFQFKYYQPTQILGAGVRLSPLGTSATNWPIVQDPVDGDECGEVGGMRIGRGNRNTRRKPAPVPLCQP
jgi:hypothetical protein